MRHTPATRGRCASSSLVCKPVNGKKKTKEASLKMLTFSLTFIRHGETQYNRDKLLQGQGVDTPLSETGVKQSEAVGRHLKDVAFTSVFASNLQRAVQTAEIILRNNTHCPGMEMVLEPLLRERGFGVAEGRPKEYLKNMANAAGQSCRDYTPLGGETLEQETQARGNSQHVTQHQPLAPRGSRLPGSLTSTLATTANAPLINSSGQRNVAGLPETVPAVIGREAATP